MLKLIILGLYIFVVFYLCYRYINYIDNKNRKLVKEWEEEYVKEYDKIYEEQYFKRLAFEKKAKEYEEIMQMKKEDRNKRLKEVGIDKQFIGYYELRLKEISKATRDLEREKAND